MLVLAAFAFAIATALTAVVRSWIGPAVLRWRAWDLRHGADQSIPRIGGLAIAAACVVVGVVGWRLAIEVSAPTAFAGADPALLVLSITLVVVLGLVDDVMHTPARLKLGIQVGAAAIAVYGGAGIDLLDIPGIGPVVLPAGVGEVLAGFWLVGIVNAFNLVDGLDGLATGLAIVALAATAAVAQQNGHAGIMISAVLMASAAGGFFVHNVSARRIFLGDSGAFFLGFGVGLLSLLAVRSGAQGAFSLHIAVLLCAVPILDVTLVVIRRLISGRSILAPDRGHLHHQVRDAGVAPRQTLLVLLVPAGILATGGVAISSGGMLIGIEVMAALSLLALVGLNFAAPRLERVLWSLLVLKLGSPSTTLTRWRRMSRTLQQIKRAESLSVLEAVLARSLREAGVSEVRLETSTGERSVGHRMPFDGVARQLRVPVATSGGKLIAAMTLDAEEGHKLDVRVIGFRLDAIGPVLSARLQSMGIGGAVDAAVADSRPVGSDPAGAVQAVAPVAVGDTRR